MVSATDLEAVLFILLARGMQREPPLSLTNPVFLNKRHRD
jgi:hypothetical protein